LPLPDDISPVLARELEYHERLYSGFAPSHFARTTVCVPRAHMVSHILRLIGVGRDARVLSLGCGIGDTELLLAPTSANSSAWTSRRPPSARPVPMRSAPVSPTSAFRKAPILPPAFDLVIGIFFLHLPDVLLAEMLRRIHDLLAPGGQFYCLIPKLMKKYQSPDERELVRRPRGYGPVREGWIRMPSRALRFRLVAAGRIVSGLAIRLRLRAAPGRSGHPTAGNPFAWQ
jgi:SAM-dependent methyltransferase